MTKQQQQKLSKAQQHVVERMEKWPNINWWSLGELNCFRRTADALERKGYVRIFYDSIAGDRWSLIPEAERVPVKELDIPF